MVDLDKLRKKLELLGSGVSINKQGIMQVKERLEKLDIPEGVVKVTRTDNVKHLSSKASSLTELAIGKGVRYVDLEGCNNLERLVLSEEIDADKIKLPSNLKEIVIDFLSGCASIVGSGGDYKANWNIHSIDGTLYMYGLFRGKFRTLDLNIESLGNNFHKLIGEPISGDKLILRGNKQLDLTYVLLKSGFKGFKEVEFIGVESMLYRVIGSTSTRSIVYGNDLKYLTVDLSASQNYIMVNFDFSRLPNLKEFDIKNIEMLSSKPVKDVIMSDSIIKFCALKDVSGTLRLSRNLREEDLKAWIDRLHTYSIQELQITEAQYEIYHDKLDSLSVNIVRRA